MQSTSRGEVAETLQFQHTRAVSNCGSWNEALDHLLALTREVESQRGMLLEFTVKGDGRGDNLIMELRPATLPSQFRPRLIDG